VAVRHRWFDSASLRSGTLFPPNMSLIYGDAFQGDEDLCNILSALHLGSHPASVTAATPPRAAPASTVIAQVARNTREVHNESPIGISLSALRNPPLAPISSPAGKYSPIHSISRGESLIGRTSAHPAGVYFRRRLHCIVGETDGTQGHLVCLTSPHINPW
jgi:hypothetical protein